MKIIKVYEQEELFDEIMEHSKVDMDISSWDYTSNEHIGYYYNARPLISKSTSHHIGWLVYEEWRTLEGEICNEFYINMKEEEL